MVLSNVLDISGHSARTFHIFSHITPLMVPENMVESCCVDILVVFSPPFGYKAHTHQHIHSTSYYICDDKEASCHIVAGIYKAYDLDPMDGTSEYMHGHKLDENCKAVYIHPLDTY